MQKFGTVECRLLPMFNSKQRAIRAIFTLIRCIESYLQGITYTGRYARQVFEAAINGVIEEPKLQETLLILPEVSVEVTY